MELLNALLAFSVSMLVFSTMSLVLVEVLHRANRTREKYFAEMIDVFFEELVWNKVATEPALSEKQLDEKRALSRDFLSIMTSVSGLVSLDIELAANDDKLASQKQKNKKSAAISQVSSKTPVGVLSSKTTERLTTVEFAQRLARTQAGQRLLTLGTLKAKAIVQDLASQLNAISSGATSDFKQRSRKMALIASAFIAISLNIDAIHLFKQFSTDKALTEKVIEHAPHALEAYEQQQQLMTTLESELADGSADAKQALSALSTQIEDSKQSIQQSATSLSQLGVPIGALYFPWCKPVNGLNEGDSANLVPRFADQRCQYLYHHSKTKNNNGLVIFGSYLAWLGGILLSIILIGQGSPFWFQMFQKLSMALQLLRSLSVGGKKKGAASETKREDDYSPDRAVEIFFQTASALPDQPVIDPNDIESSIAQPAVSRRALLTPNGTKESI